MHIDWETWWPRWKTKQKSSLHKSETEQAPYMTTVQVSHVTGHVALFDSEHKHQGFVALRVYTAERDRGLGRDWIRGDKEIIEVYMSHSQWAAMISTPNSGTGTPATLQHIFHEKVEQPSVDRRTEKYGPELVECLQSAISRIDAMGEGKLTKAQKNELAMIRQDIVSNVPFMAKSFDEHMEDRKEKAKSDIEAHMNASIQRVGYAALKASGKLVQMLEEKQ